jgi:excisionase family DNA binding protein
MTERKRQRREEQRRATVTVPEAAEILGVGRNQAYEGVKSGQIPVIRIGHRLLVPLPALERMLQGGA